MNALPSFIGLMKAQAVPHVTAKVLSGNSRPHLTVEDTLQRRRRLGLHVQVERKAPEPVAAPDAEDRPVIDATPPEEPEMAPAWHCPLNMLSACSWRFLVALAAVRNGVGVKEIMGRNRARSIVAARRDAMGLVYQHTQASSTVVGRLFNRDHTTVLHQTRIGGTATKLVELTPFIRPTKRPKTPKAEQPKPEKQERAPTALQKAVIRAYKHQVPPSVLAEEMGCNPRSVKVIAHYLGLKRSDFARKQGLGQ